MALYFENKVDSPPATTVACSSWHSKHHLYAVGFNDGEVNVYLEEGEKAPDVTIRRDSVPTVMEWHPEFELLCIGWVDGRVSVWSSHDQQLREGTVLHHHPIRLLKWSPEGRRVITGDENGLVGVWRADDKGKLTVGYQYALQGAVSSLAFGRGGAGLSDACPPFFVGGEKGLVWLADDLGKCSHAFAINAPLCALFYHDEKDSVVAVTKTALLAVYKMGEGGKLVQERKVKLSSSFNPAALSMDGPPPIGSSGAAAPRLQAVWLGAGVLATAAGEAMVRVWDLDRDCHHLLTLRERGGAGPSKPGADRFTAIAYNPTKQALAGGTKEGRLIIWKFVGDVSASSEEKDQLEHWEALAELELQGSIADLQWGPGEGLLAAVIGDSASILVETVMQRKLRDKRAVVQLSPERLVVESLESETPMVMQTSIRIRGVDVTQDHLVVWSGKMVEVFELIETGGFRHENSFEAPVRQAVLHEESLYLCVGRKVEVRSFQGEVKQTLEFAESEGEPELIDVNGSFLAVLTSNNTLRIYDVSKREAKPLTTSKRIGDGANRAERLGKVNSIRVSANGKNVSMVAMHHSKSSKLPRPSNKLWVYNHELDTLYYYDFANDRRYPISHAWDAQEPRLLACETRRAKTHRPGTAGPPSSPPSATENASSRSSTEIEVVTLFCSPDPKLVVQETFPVEHSSDAFLGIDVPFVYFVGRGGHSGDGGSGTGAAMTTQYLPTLRPRSMRDFLGLENVDEPTKAALLNFSYHLTMGNMDEAFRSVKLVQNAAVWENLAKMCVKTGRLDVAEICLGNMGHAQAARALRESEASEREARLAMVAVQLGMHDEAERLYVACGRYDQLTQLYMASNQWDKALEVAEQHDRIHLRTVHHQHARHLESIGDLAGAVRGYEQAETHRVEVPRMLWEAGCYDDLEAYVAAARDRALYRWWAQCADSKGALDEALEYYRKAADYRAMVRLYCMRGDMAAAERLYQETESADAAFQLACAFEEANDIGRAIHYYSKAGRFHHAVRLAKDTEQESELLHLALQGDQKTMLDAARFFEHREQYGKAVQLYLKGGNPARAMHLALAAGDHDSLCAMADALDGPADPSLLATIAEYFVAKAHYPRAVKLYVLGGQIDTALQLCVEHDVPITERLADQMTPPKSNDPKLAEERKRVLLAIAECCCKQGAFHLASKKYTNAGERVLAMRALLKSGDTKKIITYASVAQDPKIYIMAANYLQSQDWRDAEVMQHIENFYKRAKALDSLAAFYASCAEVEISEYTAYDKAADALREALKYLKKSKAADKEIKQKELTDKLALVEKYLEAKHAADQANGPELVKLCSLLLDAPRAASIIQLGDVYRLMIDYYHAQGNAHQAYNLLDQMKAKQLNPAYFIEHTVLADIYAAMGLEFEPPNHAELQPGSVSEELQ